MEELLFIFDCDGVLVDSEALSSEVLSREMVELGIPMSPQEAHRRFLGRSLPDCLRMVEEILGRPLSGDFLPRLQERTLAAFAGKLKPVPQVEEALAAMEQLRLRRCVASNGGLGKMKHSLALTGLLRFFPTQGADSVLFSAEQVERGKPAPDLFLFAAERMNVPVSNCIVIEDSLAGVCAAVAASMRVMAYRPPEIPVEPELLTQPLVQTFSSMGQLKAFIQGSESGLGFQF